MHLTVRHSPASPTQSTEMKPDLVFAPYALPSGLDGEAFLVSGYVLHLWFSSCDKRMHWGIHPENSTRVIAHSTRGHACAELAMRAAEKALSLTLK